MDGQRTPRIYGIQHLLGAVRSGVAEIFITVQVKRRLRRATITDTLYPRLYRLQKLSYVLHLHDHRAGLKGADGVPLVCGNAQRQHRSARTRVQGPTDRAREGLPYPASGLGEAGFGPGWLPGIGPAPIQEWRPQIPVFQADGTVSKVRRFRGDCKCGVAGNEQLQVKY